MAYTLNLNQSVTNPCSFTIKQAANTTQYALSDRTKTWVGTKSGSRVENWRAKRKAGSQAGSAYTLSRCFQTRYFPGSISVVLRDTSRPLTWPRRFETFIGMAPSPTQPTHISFAWTGVEASAHRKIIKKVREEQSHLGGLVFAGELKETIQMFKSPLKGVVDLVQRHAAFAPKRVRPAKGLRFTPKEAIKAVSDAYLEFSFGLSPLIADTEKIAEACARFYAEGNEDFLNPKREVRARSVELQTSNSFNPSWKTHGNESFFQKFSTYKSTERRLQYVVGLSANIRFDAQSNARLLQLLGINPLDMPLVAWELIPFSWVADYVANIGQIIEAGVTSTSNVNWVVRTYSTRTDERRRIDFSRSDNGIFAIDSYAVDPFHGMGELHLRQLDVIRDLPAGLGLPPLHFQSPTDSVKKMANLLAVSVSSLLRSSNQIRGNTNGRVIKWPSRYTV